MATQAALATISDRQSPQKIQARAYVQQILDDKNWLCTDLARVAGLAPSTVLRFMNDKTNKSTLSWSTIKRINEGSGYAIPRSLMEAFGVNRIESYPEGPKSTGLGGDLGPSTIRLIQVSALGEDFMPQVREVIRIARPPELQNDSTAFAFTMPDDGLGPLIPERSTLYATKARNVTKGDIVLITDEHGKSKVRLVRDVAADGIALEDQSSSMGMIRVAHDKIKNFGVVRIIGSDRDVDALMAPWRKNPMG